MPCSYFDPPGVCTNPSDKEEIAKLRKELDKVTAMLCDLCGTVEREDYGDHPPHVFLSDEQAAWWKQHKENDLRRQYHEAIKPIDDELNSMATKFKEIKKLGGEPTAASKARCKKLKQDKVDLFNNFSKYVNLLPNLPRKK